VPIVYSVSGCSTDTKQAHTPDIPPESEQFSEFLHQKIHENETLSKYTQNNTWASSQTSFCAYKN